MSIYKDIMGVVSYALTREGCVFAPVDDLLVIQDVGDGAASYRKNKRVFLKMLDRMLSDLGDDPARRKIENLRQRLADFNGEIFDLGLHVVRVTEGRWNGYVFYFRKVGDRYIVQRSGDKKGIIIRRNRAKNIKFSANDTVKTGVTDQWLAECEDEEDPTALRVLTTGITARDAFANALFIGW